MGISERYTMIYEIICCISCIGKALHSTDFHNIPIEFHSAEHTCKQSDAALYGINRIKGKLLVFLHIFIVGKGNSFHGSQNGHQCTIYSACLTTY